MLAMRPTVLFALALGILGLDAAPTEIVRPLNPEHRWRPRQNGNGLTAQEQAAQIPDGIFTATDGSTILDTTVTVKYASPPGNLLSRGRLWSSF